MDQCEFRFFSLGDGLSLVFQPDSDDMDPLEGSSPTLNMIASAGIGSGQTVGPSAIMDFNAMFADSIDNDNLTATIKPFQRNSADLRAKLDSFIAKYGKVIPEIYNVKRFVESLKEGEYFAVGNSVRPSSEEISNITLRLIALNENREFEQVVSEHEEQFGPVTDHYHVLILRTHRKVRIGERNKHKRICRFCGKGQPDVQFTKTAHAISEALGNKNIILNEECDSCNEKFGREIERDLIHLLSLYRIFYGVCGKEGVATIKSENCEFRPNGTELQILFKTGAPKAKTIAIKNQNCKYLSDGGKLKPLFYANVQNHDDLPPYIDVQFNEEVIPQNIYKTLCKYALSIVDSQNIHSFKETIRWIRGEKDYDRLPKVGIQLRPLSHIPAPNIFVYLRKVRNCELPHAVGEFHFTCLTFVFIIPLSSEDYKTFDNDPDFETFWKFFKHYGDATRWKFEDFSGLNTRKPSLRINIEKGVTSLSDSKAIE